MNFSPYYITGGVGQHANRWPELDGLRGVAVLLVIFFHTSPFGPVSGGFIGVDIFFVLSAFLITSILMTEIDDTGRIDLLRFYWRRFLRLTPALALMLAAYWYLAPTLWPGHPHGRDALLTLLYLSDYSYAIWDAPLYLQHSWSLAAEEHFYLLWPFLLLILGGHARILPILYGLWIAATLWRASFDDWGDYYYRLDTRMSGFLIGSLLYFVLPRLRLKPAYAAAALAAIAAVAMVASIRDAHIYIVYMELAAAALIGCCVTGKAGLIGAALRMRLMVGIGKLSYGMYLWHFPFAYYVRDQWSFAATVAATFLFSLTMAAISYFTVEAVGRWARDPQRRAARRTLPSEIA